MLDRMRRGFTRWMCAAALLLAAGPAVAQDPLELEQPVAGGGQRDWGLAVTPYGWFAAQSTDVGTKKLRQSFNDLASIVNVGFQGRVVARWRWLVLTGDWTYADLGSTQQIGRVTVTQGIRQNILDLKLGGKVYDTRPADGAGGMGLWVSAGGRYWDNKVDVLVVTQPVLPGGSESQESLYERQTWWDPVLGVTMHFPVSPKVGFLVRATGGGFGIGNASTYMWDGEAGALFRVARRLWVSASYREFKYNRTDGEGDAAVEQTVTVVGPSVGLSIGIF